MVEMSDIQSVVTRAMSKLDEIGAVLDSASDDSARAAALNAWRTAHATELAALTAEIRSFPLEDLKPVITAERDKHPAAAAAIEGASRSNDPALIAEWSALSGLFGGPS
jgi:hypothetical protein